MASATTTTRRRRRGIIEDFSLNYTHRPTDRVEGSWMLCISYSFFQDQNCGSGGATATGGRILYLLLFLWRHNTRDALFSISFKEKKGHFLVFFQASILLLIIQRSRPVKPFNVHRTRISFQFCEISFPLHFLLFRSFNNGQVVRILGRLFQPVYGQYSIICRRY